MFKSNKQPLAEMQGNDHAPSGSYVHGLPFKLLYCLEPYIKIML
jgi:hypothetical protein